MGYTYKQLGGGDVPTFKQLLRVFGEAFDDMHAYQSAIPQDDYLRSLLTSEQFIALVALVGDAVVGGLTGYVLEKFEQDRREVYIYDLAVRAEDRRKHAATGLIDELRRLARDRGAYSIYVQADQSDGPAVKLYESVGTKREVFHFDIKL